MKKRIISMLLTVLMIMSLFSGMSVGAYAETGNTIQYTMVSGDYVLRICQKLGLNYYTCKDAIMKLNNITEGQWNKLPVGRVLTLPASDYDAMLISTNGAGANAAATGTTSTVTGTATTTATTSTVTNTATTRSADTLAYYLVPYTMAPGDTVSAVCNNLGVNFNIFSSFIAEINGIKSWTKVRAGQTILVPTTVTPTVGTSCFGVYAHKVVNNDTAYSITSANGVNLNAQKTVLEALNQTSNLAAIKVGDTFFYPTPMTVSVPGTSNPGTTTSTTTTTTVTDGNGTSTTTKTTTATLYKLSSSLTSSDGTMLFYVNDQPVTAAPAGATVTVVTNTEPGKAISGLTVKHANGIADLHLTADSFIMPNCDVRVDATVKTGHDISIVANYSGKSVATVGGITVQSAVKGAAVQIVSADPNYEIDSLYVYYQKLVSSANKTPVTVSSSKAFIMPDMPVTVEVTLKPVSTYAFYVNDPANGSFFLQVNGSAATRAAKGAKVTIVAKADDGYEPSSLSVYKHGSTAAADRVNVFSNTFTMPAFDVDITMNFVSTGNNILILPSLGGDATAELSTAPGTWITEANTGVKVYLVDAPETTPIAYQLDATNPYDVVRNSDGLKVKVQEDSTGYFFVMPKGGVTVTPHFVGKTQSAIGSVFYMNGTPLTAAQGYKDASFSVTIDGKKTEFLKTGDNLTNVASGQYIDLRYDCNEGVAFVKFEILVAGAVNEELTNEANLHGYFQMPAKSITIAAYFETGKVAIGPAAITGVGTVSYRNNTSGDSINSCDPNETVRIYVTPGNGFSFDYSVFRSKLTVTRKDNGAPITLTPVSPVYSGGKLTSADYFTFTMPAEGVDVACVFDPKPFTIRMRCVDETGRDLTGLGLWQIAVNGVLGIVDNTGGVTTVSVAYEDGIVVAMTEAGYSNYDMVSFRIDGHEYIADVLNYFYNFSMVGERAKDLEIIAVMRPRIPVSPTIHALSAIYDTSKGGVEFILLEKDPITGDPSATGYADFSRSGGTNYYASVASGVISNATFTKYAIAGDYVGIIAKSVDSKYTVNTSSFSIIPLAGDADRIIPTKLTAWTVNGVTTDLYVFKMPDSDIQVSVTFGAARHQLNIHVREMDGVTPVTGMVRMYNGSVYRDVLSDDSFDDIGYNTQIQILRSEFAISEGMKIASVDIKTSSGDVVPYYDMSGYGEGIYFAMPDDDKVDVYIRIDKQTQNVPVITWDNVVNGTLEFRQGPTYASLPVDFSNIKVGDLIYIFPQPNAGYDYLEEGELKVYNNGVLNTVNIHTLDPSNAANNIWVYEVKGGVNLFEAAFEEAAPAVYPITISAPAGAHISVTFNGGNWIYSNGDSFNAPEGAYVAFAPADEGYSAATITSMNSFPTLNDPDSGIGYYQVVGIDTVTVSLSMTGSRIITDSNIGADPVIQFTSGGAPLNPENVTPGTSVQVKIADSGNYTPKEIVVTDIASTSTTISVAGGIANFTMPAGGGDATLTVVYELKAVPVSFAGITGTDIVVFRINDSDTDNFVDVSTTAPITLHAGDVITVRSGVSGRTITGFTSTADTTARTYVNTYTVPNVPALTLTFAIS